MKRSTIIGTVALGLAGVVAGAVVLGRSCADDDRSEAGATPAPHTAAEPPAVAFALERWGNGLPRAGQWRHGFAVVDFNGDGQLDIVHGPARESPERTPQIFAGDGHGNFKLETRYTFPKLPLDYGDVAVADFDADGALDLAVASHLIGVAVLVRRGDAFEPYGTDIGLLGAPAEKDARRSALGTFSSRAIEAIDWNHDGRTDLIASSDGPRPFEAIKGGRSRRNIAVLIGKPGGFVPIFPVNDIPGHGDSLAIGDIEPTPGLEIVAASNVAGSKDVLYRLSEVGLVLSELPGMPAGRTVRVVALVSDRSGARVLLGGMAAGDKGLEGTLDVVRAGSAPMSTRLYKGAPLRAVSAIGVGDLDADGASDAVIGEEDGTLRVFVDRRGEFVPAGAIAPSAQLAGCAVYGIAFANLDDRPGEEVVASYAGDDGACASSGAIEIYRHP